MIVSLSLSLGREPQESLPWLKTQLQNERIGLRKGGSLLKLFQLDIPELDFHVVPGVQLQSDRT